VEDISSLDVDPFLLHFERELPAQVTQILSGYKPYSNTLSCTWPKLENFDFQGVPAKDVEEDTAYSETVKSLNISAVKKSKLVKIPAPPSRRCPLNQRNPTLESLCIKTQLHLTIPVANQVSTYIGIQYSN
jgi:hypothetical protein